MPLLPETRLGPYQIRSLLGSGGMGEVYLAHDTRLGRDVAVKVLPEPVSGNPDRLRRFEREARAAAALNHPGILAVYDVGWHEGAPYIVSELLEGETLRERLRAGGFTVQNALEVALPLARALAAAHEKGIVHRDLKPENVFLTRDQQVKVLDFGLAKLLPTPEPGSESSIDTRSTASGIVLGTASYMSPEQVRGQDTDARSDVFSFGVLLYEMLAGQRPFRGESAADVMAAILQEDPPKLLDLDVPVSRQMERITERCLRKKPGDRFQSAHDLATALEAVSGAESAGRAALSGPMARRLRRMARRPWVAALVLLAIGGVATWGLWRSRSGTPAAGEKRLVVAVAPFYGPDTDSAKEGRMMAALVERAVAQRLAGDDVKILGLEETRQPLRDHAAARALGERMGATVVIWGDAFVLPGEAEIQPYLTMVPVKPTGSGRSDRARALNAANPFNPLGERAGGSMILGGQTPNQIDLRKTGAAGVGDLVLILAGTHALYREGKPEKALTLFRQAPRTSEALRYQAEALISLNRADEAMAALTEAVALDPRDAQAWASLADLRLAGGARSEAVDAYARAAGSGGSYTTRRALLHDGLLYVRESTLHGTENKSKEDDTGYLLAVDPRIGHVQERYLLPGEVRSLRPTAGAIEISYVSAPDQGAPATIVLSQGHMDRPVVGRGLRLRLQAVNGGQALAANFVGQPGFAFKENEATAARTLPDLEAALRAAIERDPTQPWHVMLLGQALWSQGRKDEARGQWERTFSSAYASIHYDEFASMASLLEQLGQPEWADRAYAQALDRRRRLAQPIESTTLIERLISARFASVAARGVAGGPARAHLWLERARELTGLTEGDDFAAEHWRRYFQSTGQAQRAEAERDFQRKVQGHPANFPARLARFDYALTVFMGLAAGVWLFLLILLFSPGRGPLAGRFSLASFVSSVSPGERRALLAGWMACLLAALPVVVLSARLDTLISLPLPSLMDSFAGVSSLIPLERMVKETGTSEARYAAAVAHHMAGNAARARELYQGMEDDPRAQKNLKALDEGSLTPPEVLTAEEYLHAFTVRSWGEWPGLLASPGLDLTYFEFRLDFITAAVRSTVLAGVLLLPAFLLIPSQPRDPASGRVGGRLARLAWHFVPGAFDVWHGSPWRGYLSATLFGLAAFVSLVKLATVEGSFAPGLLSGAGMRGVLKASPLPPGADVDSWTQMWVYPQARLFWACVGVAVLGFLWLHTTALRAAGKSPAKS